MKKFYVVKDLGGGFDGLVVSGEKILSTVEYLQKLSGVQEIMTNILVVEEILDPNSTIGSDPKNIVSLPVPFNGLFINVNFLEETDDPSNRVFVTDNPYGEVIAEGEMTLGDLKVTYLKFADSVTITLVDPGNGRTLFSHNFRKDPSEILDSVQKLMSEEGTDSDDLFFELNDLKEKNK